MGNVDVGTIVAAVMAVILLLDVSVMWLLGRPTPDLLEYLIGAVFGFYFGRDQGRRPNGGTAGNGNGNGSANGKPAVGGAAGGETERRP